MTWRVWVKGSPSVYVEVTESDALTARVLGACDLSARTRAPIMFDDLVTLPLGSNVVSLEFERMRRAHATSHVSIR